MSAANNHFMITIQAEDPARGTLDFTHHVDPTDLDTYNGPLGRIIIYNPAGPDAQFVMKADEFIIMLAQFIQQFRGIQ